MLPADLPDRGLYFPYHHLGGPRWFLFNEKEIRYYLETIGASDEIDFWLKEADKLSTESTFPIAVRLG